MTLGSPPVSSHPNWLRGTSDGKRCPLDSCQNSNRFMFALDVMVLLCGVPVFQCVVAFVKHWMPIKYILKGAIREQANKMMEWG